MFSRGVVGGVCRLQNQLSLLGFRRASSLNAKPELIGRGIFFRPAFDSKIPEEHRPLVLLYSWLDAKAQYAFKYGDIYINKGFDVLQIQTGLMQISRPVKAHTMAQHLLDFVNDRKPLDDQPVLVHSFSAGTYFFGETVIKILTEPDKYGAIGKRIVGQIFDSAMEYRGFSSGLSKALTQNKAAQLTMESVLEISQKIAQKFTVKYYARSYKYLCSNDLRTPTLLLYSRDDPVAIPEPIENIARNFHENGIPTYMKAWDKSAHVKHFQHHPEEYMEMLDMFFERVGLLDLEQKTSVKM